MARPCWSRSRASTDWSMAILRHRHAAGQLLLDVGVRRDRHPRGDHQAVVLGGEVPGEGLRRAAALEQRELLLEAAQPLALLARPERRRQPLLERRRARRITGARSSVNPAPPRGPGRCGRRRPARPATAASFSQSSAASCALTRACGPRRSKTSATTASRSTSAGGGAVAGMAGGTGTAPGAASGDGAIATGASSTGTVDEISWKRPTLLAGAVLETSTSFGLRSRTIRPFLSRATKSTDTSVRGHTDRRRWRRGGAAQGPGGAEAQVQRGRGRGRAA